MKAPDLRLVLPLAGLAVAGAVIFAFLRDPIPPASVGVATLDSIRTRGVVYLEEEKVFVVATREGFLALVNDSQHLSHDVFFCPSSKMFQAPAHGEVFDRYGRYYAGPAGSDMDRVKSFVEGEIVHIDTNEILETKNRSRSALEPVGEFCEQTDPNNPGFFAAND